MNIYAVVLNERNEDAWERLKAEWEKPDYLIVTNHIAFVAAKEGITSEDVMRIVGMDDERMVSGFVTRVNYSMINGWNRQALWQWLDDHQ